jgi:hypothetical protein
MRLYKSAGRSEAAALDMGRGSAERHSARENCYLTAVAANFFTMASSSFRSLSFRLVE